ncbi:hypothetical protein K469DRAFT_556789 [Zopfia rhizophila CBS 207.26]|uniref:Uncharacterized protein n=1 Tax=Zopfia rhizophila CBS 207.26 TaxID=1314779 RepID=A0A6A6EI98_9PEZI|nr:hypothetical protein K469DRAFT_556789 [Zopfia rhizophila CBS 207.26]
MLRDASFRSLIGLLLAIQAVCWLLALLDLFSPGKPLFLFQNSTDIITLVSRRSSALLHRGFCAYV